jgi:DNA-binding transcriptional regulator YdaS (Cro superfamily)
MTLHEFLLKTSQTELAKAIGVSQTMVSSWVLDKKRVASERVFSICLATSWQVTPHELRPDLYPHPHDGLPVEMREAA